MPDRVKDACEACFDAHKGDCSGFVRAVGTSLGVTITGLANEITDALSAGGPWRELDDGVAAAASAAAGKFVVAGLRGDEQATPDAHGHVVVVVAGQPLAHEAYPFGYWGRLGGVGSKNTTINFAWNANDRDNVTYAERDI